MQYKRHPSENVQRPQTLEEGNKSSLQAGNLKAERVSPCVYKFFGVSTMKPVIYQMQIHLMHLKYYDVLQNRKKFLTVLYKGNTLPSF